MYDVIWSINIMLAILIVGVGVSIYYIMMYDYYWPNGSDDTTEQEELLQLQSDTDRQGA